MQPFFKRVIPGPATQDPSTIAAHTYNEPAGSRKSSEVGRHLLPLNSGSGTPTTNATTAIVVGKGKNLAVYNNAATVGSITLGDSANPPTSQAPGAVQASTTQNVGIACAPNSWTYIALADQDQVIASAATLLVYLIDDPTSIKQEATK
jgi:hypothetical protein